MIGNYAGAAFVVLGFSWLFLRLQLVERSRQINGIVRQSAVTAADRSLSDAVKGRVLRNHSLSLFGLFASLTVGLALAVGLPLCLAWVLAFTHVWTFHGVLAATLSWPLLIAGILPLVVILLRSTRRREG